MKLTTCHNCNTTTADPCADGWKKTSLASRGGRSAYLCPDCARLLFDYYEKNDVMRGVSCGGGFTYGVEFECHNPTVDFRVEMADAGFIPSHDCTTDVEFKSPIFRSLKWQKRLDTWETLRNAGAFNLTDDDGTHIHVGHETYITPETMDVVREYVRPLFGPLSDAISRTDPAIVWGRDYNGYCDLGVSRYDRYHFVNVTNNYTIEFRLCKFASAAQYKALLKMCKGITERVVKWLASGNIDDDSAMRTGTTIAKYYRREYAKIAQSLR